MLGELTADPPASYRSSVGASISQSGHPQQCGACRIAQQPHGGARVHLRGCGAHKQQPTRAGAAETVAGAHNVPCRGRSAAVLGSTRPARPLQGGLDGFSFHSSSREAVMCSATAGSSHCSCQGCKGIVAGPVRLSQPVRHHPCCSWHW